MPVHGPWTGWVQGTTMSATTTTTVWLSWTETSANTTAAQVNPWTQWLGQAAAGAREAATAMRQFADGVANLPSLLTPEQRQEAERRGQEEAERYARKQAEAVERATKLLLEQLTDEQAAEYERDKRFHVELGGRRYRLNRGWAGNVQLVDAEGRIRGTFCIHPTVRVPPEDNLLAQKLLLETDEARFLEIANRS